MVGGLTDARKTYSSLAFRKQEELSVRALVSLALYQIPRKGVILLLGSITLILPTVLMKPSSYLKVTANISLIITLQFSNMVLYEQYFGEINNELFF